MRFTDIWSICPTPRAESVVKGDTWRITVLTDSLLRLEYEDCICQDRDDHSDGWG